MSIKKILTPLRSYIAYIYIGAIDKAVFDDRPILHPFGDDRPKKQKKIAIAVG